MFKFWSKNQTFRPKKSHQRGTHRYELHKQAKATLGSGNLREAVKLPEGEDLNEWIAVNTVDFFNQINLLFGSISQVCTDEKCPVMSAGPSYEYHWADGVEVKKPIKVSAPMYMNYLMNWIQCQLDDESLFPSRIDVPFPRTFLPAVKKIFTRLFRVYAHIYYSHFQKVVDQGEEAHLNTCFKHFYWFIETFKLVEAREMAPLEALVKNIRAKEKL